MMQTKNSPPFYRPGYHRVPSKVVSIPVQFVGSERSRTDSAIKIQRMLRGFFVRNAMKKIGSMRVELERIESGIRMEVLRREQKERVRVIETIMNLLLRLDSVRVLHYSGLRECRKSVIRKAIALQEMLDEMSLPDSASEGEKMEEKEDGEEGKSFVKEEKDDGNKRELLLEKLVEENQKMMDMMVQLFQRNETHTTLLTSLSQRVEKLERRKKKSKSDVKNKQNRTKNGFH